MRRQKQYTRTSAWTKILWLFFAVFVSVNLAIWITGYTYIYKTILYTYPDIDDLGIFETSIVNESQHHDWPNAHDYNLQKLPAATREVLEKNESVAFVVIHNDSVLYEEYWDHYYPNSLSNSFSMAKSIVGIATGIAADEGKILLDDPVGKYLPHFKDSMNARLTIRHLLMMASGLNWDESYNSIFSPMTDAYYGSNLNKIVQRLKVIEEPGKTFRYMSINTVLLAMIIHKATGKTISEYVSEKIWQPIGAAHPAYWSLDRKNGDEKAFCCFYADARDFARFGQLYLDSGRWYGKTIVSKDFVRQSLSPNGLIDDKGKPADYYGYQWWLLNHRNHHIFYARGINGQYIVAIPELRLVFVRLGKKRGEKLPDNHYSDMIAYVDGVLDTWEK